MTASFLQNHSLFLPKLRPLKDKKTPSATPQRPSTGVVEAVYTTQRRPLFAISTAYFCQKHGLFFISQKPFYILFLFCSINSAFWKQNKNIWKIIRVYLTHYLLIKIEFIFCSILNKETATLNQFYKLCIKKFTKNIYKSENLYNFVSVIIVIVFEVFFYTTNSQNRLLIFLYNSNNSL